MKERKMTTSICEACGCVIHPYDAHYRAEWPTSEYKFCSKCAKAMEIIAKRRACYSSLHFQQVIEKMSDAFVAMFKEHDE